MPYDLNGRTITERLASLECGQPRCSCHRATRTGRGLTHCPTHGPDRHPSLSVTTALNGTFLAHCFTGCRQDTVWYALFGNLRLGQPREDIVDTTIYSVLVP